MSHLKERREKNCLNCNAQIYGKYCHICGQENIEPKETVWHLVTHFFNDITHFDGKFFNTLRMLMLRPGFLSREYMAGRRASYLNPVRMYVFTSAFFFLIFFTLYKSTEKLPATKQDYGGKTVEEVDKMDSAAFAQFTININKEDKKPAVPMTRTEFKRYADSSWKNVGIGLLGMHYKTREEYDSMLKAGVIKDGWLARLVKHKLLAIYKKYDGDNDRIFEAFKTGMLHSLPQILFVSLPLLALLLKLLYVRRKNFYYADHAIFSIQFYIFLFISMLFLFGLSELNLMLHWSFISFVTVILSIGLFFYEYKALRNFYQQGRAKTIAKFLLLNFMFLIVMLLLFSVFALFSFLNI